ncbi:unnamed protein product [Plutella xylostella]|uniref:(diamondback moth) hypothetical protein n=1 Tax=Plutella xylostella TaxID=51655 RepID=A0A8S4FY40_PLUXY|nr:unnamed protein product [Plutella xylostella]
MAHRQSSSNTGLTVLMVLLVLLVLAGAALLLLYYRRRVRNLKREIAHVHYTHEPERQPDQHFDNPVYSFQTSVRGDDSTTLLNNAHHIHNNLGGGKLTNTHVEMLRARASSSTNSSDKTSSAYHTLFATTCIVWMSQVNNAHHIHNNLGGGKLTNTHVEMLRARASSSTNSSNTYDPLSSLKNKDADLTNPNLYHCIEEDNKLDHVYDEIKQKEGFGKNIHMLTTVISECACETPSRAVSPFLNEYNALKLSAYDPLSSLKNKDADLTNPNLYHCIEEDNKLDLVYDEIKQKEGFKMEYDHLNYTPPANKWKPHYQRMTNGFTSPPAQPVPLPRNATPTPPIPPLPKLKVEVPKMTVEVPKMAEEVPKEDTDSVDTAPMLPDDETPAPIPPKREGVAEPSSSEAE